MQTIILTGSDLVSVTRNVGKVSSQGFEAELTWQTPLDGLLINAMAAFTTADEKWRFALKGKNLSDERQPINTFDISVIANAGYTAPRTWAISAEYSF